jgi:hypothetical protein
MTTPVTAGREGVSSPTPRIDPQGRYLAWGKISYTIVGVYLFLELLVLLFIGRPGTDIAWWAPWAISAFLLLSLARYLSTHYRIDDLFLRASRILGGTKLRLDQVRRIEFVSLRDLSPTTGMMGSWGWRGRMWSPIIGRFDSIHTDAAHGLLVSAGDDILYLSPRNSAAFARELSRRVRSYSGRLAVDVGDPLAGPAPTRV